MELSRQVMLRNMTTVFIQKFVKSISSQEIDGCPEWNLENPLPRLPVPPLDGTLELYLKLMEPVVDSQQLEKTKRIVQEFGRPGGVGETIQKKLQEIAEDKENWVADWWLEDMYLRNPQALPINSNPGMVFPRQTFGHDNRQQLRFAAQLISGILDYKTILDMRGLPAERARHSRKGQPLCMEQYYRLFSSYRIPGRELDQLLTRRQKDPFEPEFIVVVCNEQFFTVEVKSSGGRLSEEDLYNQLRRVAEASEDVTLRQEAVGILTTSSRDQWAINREKLMEDEQNRRNLELIENCIFALCLDKAIPIAFNHESSKKQTEANIRDDVSLSLQMIHGMGSRFNAANRWYDKTMQFVVSKDGNCGLNYEHSVSEGIAVIKLIEHILKYMEEVKERRLQRFSSICDLEPPKRLHWNIDKEMHMSIKKAKEELDKLADDLDLYILRYNKFGRDFPKKVNMSPDSFIQLALQLAHYKLHRCLVPTYESASIRRYALGRVDVIRAASIPALKWCRAMVGEIDCPMEEKVLLLRQAMEWQTEVMLASILGFGVDNHLLGLRETAKLIFPELPDFFEDETYKESQRFRLSTSQVPTTMDAFLAYGAVVPNGYGAAYNPHSDNIVVCISCWKCCQETQALPFARSLEEAFGEMYRLLSSHQDLARRSSKKLRSGGSRSHTSSVSSPTAENPMSPDSLTNGATGMTNTETITEVGDESDSTAPLKRECCFMAQDHPSMQSDEPDEAEQQ